MERVYKKAKLLSGLPRKVPCAIAEEDCQLLRLGKDCLSLIFSYLDLDPVFLFVCKKWSALYLVVQKKKLWTKIQPIDIFLLSLAADTNIPGSTTEIIYFCEKGDPTDRKTITFRQINPETVFGFSSIAIMRQYEIPREGHSIKHMTSEKSIQIVEDAEECCTRVRFRIDEYETYKKSIIVKFLEKANSHLKSPSILRFSNIKKLVREAPITVTVTDLLTIVNLPKNGATRFMTLRDGF